MDLSDGTWSASLCTIPGAVLQESVDSRVGPYSADWEGLDATWTEADAVMLEHAAAPTPSSPSVLVPLSVAAGGVTPDPADQLSEGASGQPEQPGCGGLRLRAGRLSRRAHGCAVPAAADGNRTARRPSHTRRPPAMRRFLYPDASQIARDTPRARPRPGAAARILVPVDGSGVAAQPPPPLPAGPLTPSEERDVRSCVATIATSLDEDDEAFFTQCRVSRVPSAAAPPASAMIFREGEVEQCQSACGGQPTVGIGAVSLSGGDADDAEIDKEAACQQVPLRPAQSDKDDRGDAPTEICRGKSAGFSTAGGGAMKTSVAALARDSRLFNDLEELSKPKPDEAVDVGMTTFGAAHQKTISDTVTSGPDEAPSTVGPAAGFSTPCGRVAGGAGAVRAKRLWSHAAEGDDQRSEDESCLSPVLSSHKKRRTRDATGSRFGPNTTPGVPPVHSRKRPNPTADGRLEEGSTEADDVRDGVEKSGPLARTVRTSPCPSDGTHASEYAGFRTAGGRSVAVSAEAMQKASAFLEDVKVAYDASCGKDLPVMSHNTGWSIEYEKPCLDCPACETSTAETFRMCKGEKLLPDSIDHTSVNSYALDSGKNDASGCQPNDIASTICVQPKMAGGTEGMTVDAVLCHVQDVPTPENGETKLPDEPSSVRCSDADAAKRERQTADHCNNCQCSKEKLVTTPTVCNNLQPPSPILPTAVATANTPKTGEIVAETCPTKSDMKQVDDTSTASCAESSLRRTAMDGCVQSCSSLRPQSGSGFETASGRLVNVSESALRRAKQMFRDATEGELKRRDVRVRGRKAAGDAQAKLDIGSCLKPGRPEADPVSSDERADRSGQVRPAVAPLKHAGGFGNLDSHSERLAPSIYDRHLPSALGFQTASGKQVAVSSESLATAKSLFYDIGNLEIHQEQANTHIVCDESTGIDSVYSSTSGHVVEADSSAAGSAPSRLVGDIAANSGTSRGLPTLRERYVRRKSLGEVDFRPPNNVGSRLSASRTASGRTGGSRTGPSRSTGGGGEVGPGISTRRTIPSDDSRDRIATDTCPTAGVHSAGIGAGGGWARVVSDETLEQTEGIPAGDPSDDIGSASCRNNGKFSKDLGTYSECDVVVPHKCKHVPGVNMGHDQPDIISEESAQETRAMPAKTSNDATSENSSKIFNKMSGTGSGFVTETGRMISISEEALRTAKALSDDASREVSPKGVSEALREVGTNLSDGFITAAGRAMTASAEALKKARALLDISCDDAGFHTCSEIGEVQLQKHGTGPGRAGSAQKESLRNDRDVSVDKSDVDTASRRSAMENVQPRCLASGVSRAVAPTEESPERIRSLQCDYSCDTAAPRCRKLDEGQLRGSVTGAGKSAAISEESFKRARTLLGSNSQDHSVSMRAGVEWSQSRGPATEASRTAAVSAECREKARPVVDAGPCGDAGSKGCSNMEEVQPRGFVTGAGRVVTVSEESLANAGSLPARDSCDVISNRRPKVVAEPWEANRAARISEDALLKGNVMLDDYSLVVSCKRPPMREIQCCGFVTGSGQSAKISKEALKKAKAMLYDSSCDSASKRRDTELPGPCGCLTGTGRIAIKSDIPVKKTRVALDDDSKDFGVVKEEPGKNTSIPTRESTGSSSNHFSQKTSCGKTDDELSDGRTPTQSAAVIGACADGDDPVGLALCLSGLTQCLDERFEFTQVVANRSRQQDERSASPVLGTTPQDRSARRRRCRPAAEATTFRTPYRRRADEGASATSVASVQRCPAGGTADSCPLEAGSAGAEVTAVAEQATGGERRGDRTSARLAQTERVAAGCGGPTLRTVGSVLARRLQGVGRTSLRHALGDVPARLTKSELMSLGVESFVLDVTFASAHLIRLPCVDTLHIDGCDVIPADDNTVGVAEVMSALLASQHVQADLMPAGWLQNAYRHLVWKLASYERRFPKQMAGRALTVRQVVQQLRYRYDRELDRCQRPALRRITEGDDAAAKTLVLCVAEVVTTPEAVSLCVSDGWYCVSARLDRALERLARQRRLWPGLKLVIHGAELVGQRQPCSPLEATSELCLRISANSCRRARWDVRLGYHSSPAPFPVGLASVLPDGSAVSRLDVVVARVYPLLYFHKEDGRSVFLTSRREERRAAAAEAGRQARLERLYADVERELSAQPTDGQPTRRPASRALVRQLSSGHDIFEYISRAADPSSVESLLTDQQKLLAAEYQRQHRDRQRELIEAKFRSRLQQLTDDSHPPTPLLKIRVTGKASMPAGGAILTLWRPTEEVQMFLTEGRPVSVCGATAAGKRDGVLQLTAGSQCRFLPFTGTLEAPPRVLAHHLAPRGAAPPFGEVDVVALVLRVSEPGHGGRQTSYLADRSGSLMRVCCWQGLQSLGLNDVVVTGAELAFANLQLSSACAPIPEYFLTERSQVSPRTRLAHLAAEMELLSTANTAGARCAVAEHPAAFHGQHGPGQNCRWAEEVMVVGEHAPLHSPPS